MFGILDVIFKPLKILLLIGLKNILQFIRLHASFMQQNRVWNVYLSWKLMIPD